jgi:soluble lytic murein transglycosylase-like protein
MYDVPISDDLQFFIQEWCKEYGIDPKLVLAVIKVESNFRCNAYNADTDCCGLMQIKGMNLPTVRAELGVTDLFNAYENAMGGIYLLRQALNYDGDIEHALLIYNNGLGGAKELFYKGIHSTEYSRKVLEARDNLKVREYIYEEM